MLKLTLNSPAPVCPPPGRYLSGRRLVGLTHRAQLKLNTRIPDQAAADAVPAAANGGFLAEIFESNDRLRQQMSAIASTDFQTGLTFAEVTATAPSGGGDIDQRPNTQLFKDTLLARAIEMAGAKKESDVVLVKWRSETTALDGVSRMTIFNVGFDPPALHTEFLRRAKVVSDTTVGGFRIFQSGITVLNAPSVRGFRFFVPIPPGWSDEMLYEAMVMQGNLNHDHVLSFGADLAKGLKVSAPSGDMFFNYAPDGCITHGSDTVVPILQPPNRMFVEHPVTGVENHLTLRKVGACKDCWKPGRHDGPCPYKGICKVCNELWADMPDGGKRHACSQGHLSKPRGKNWVDPGVVSNEQPPPSPLAAKLLKKQEENIAAAKAKRKRDEEPPPAQQADMTPSEVAAAEAATEPSSKSSKNTGNDSPGGASPGGPKAAKPAPAATVNKPSRRGKNN
jgi:hypothetical protein